MATTEPWTSALDELVLKWDLPKLEVFEPEPDSALFPLFAPPMKRSESGSFDDSFIREIPGRAKVPSLLLHDLTNKEHKKTSEYVYTDTNTEYGPCAFYATSGAGKTRRVFEYLAHNYGLYFVAEKGRNPGSGDMVGRLEYLRKNLASVKVKNDNEDVQAISKANHQRVEEIVDLLVMARIAVFVYISDKYERHPTPYEWLLLQLYPKEYLGTDVFDRLAFEWTLNKIPSSFRPLLRSITMGVFIDEAQVLKKYLLDNFVSSNNSNIKISAYKALLQGFMGAAQSIGYLKFPLFCSTGLSLSTLTIESESIMSKPDTYRAIFSDFKPLTPSGVDKYIRQFLNFDSVGKDLVEHVCKWLRGRPRWTATFLETFLIQKDKKKGFLSSLGNFEPEQEGRLIRSLDQYIDRMTNSQESFTTDNTRLSWEPGASGAYSAIERMALNASADLEVFVACSRLMQAAFRFSMTGEGQTLRDSTAKLIERGIASVIVKVGAGDDRSKKFFVECTIDEPLIVQACINYFQLDSLLEDEIIGKDGHAEKGNAFENFLIPPLQRKFKQFVKAEMKDDIGDNDEYDVPKMSSYGVLVRKCDDPSATMKWLRDSMDARFEGPVEPFCRPDTLMGPDILCFLRNAVFQPRLLALQTKCRYKVNQLHALRTILPKLFYCQNRSLASPSLNKNGLGESKKLWLDTQNALFLPTTIVCTDDGPKLRNKRARENQVRTQKVVRMLVQFPARRSRNSLSGPVDFSAISACKENCAEEHNHDALVVIDEVNAGLLFNKSGQELLNHLKYVDCDYEEPEPS